MIVLEVCPQMPTLTRVSTTEMEVTSIRLERSLKEKLKALAGDRGYQALIRDILWQYVESSTGEPAGNLSPDDIRASFEAIAEQKQSCAVTGKTIQPNEPMRLGLTVKGALVPLCVEAQ
jgi:hypothetical protein